MNATPLFRRLNETANSPYYNWAIATTKSTITVFFHATDADITSEDETYLLEGYKARRGVVWEGGFILSEDSITKLRKDDIIAAFRMRPVSNIKATKTFPEVFLEVPIKFNKAELLKTLLMCLRDETEDPFAAFTVYENKGSVCKKSSAKGRRRMTFEAFKSILEHKHPKLFATFDMEVTESEWVDSKTKTPVECKVHKDRFLIVPAITLNKGVGCPKCYRDGLAKRRELSAKVGKGALKALQTIYNEYMRANSTDLLKTSWRLPLVLLEGYLERGADPEAFMNHYLSDCLSEIEMVEVETWGKFAEKLIEKGCRLLKFDGCWLEWSEEELKAPLERGRRVYVLTSGEFLKDLGAVTGKVEFMSAKSVDKMFGGL